MLQIRKKLENVFKHYNQFGDFMLSKGYFKLDNGVFQIVEEGGARRFSYSLSEITIYDDTAGSVAENYTTDIALYARLVELRYNLLDLDGLAPSPNITNITESPLDLPFEGSNSFTLPENYFLVSVFVNIALNKKVRYTRNATSITILDTLEVGDIVNIRGFVASGNFSPIVPSGGCITAECVESLPTFDNDLEAVSLPNYTPYKTNTGEIRYKLPGTMPPSSEWIDEEEWIDESEWID